VLRRNVHAFAPLAAATLWGGMYVVAKWGLSIVPPVTLSFLRVAVGAAVLLALVRTTKPARTFTRGERLQLLALGAAITVTLLTQFVGTELTNASQSSLLTVLTPVFTLVLGVAVLGEPLTRAKAVGMTLALVGTAVVLSGEYDLAAMAEGSLVGVLALLAASFAWGVYTVWGRDLVRRYSALEITTYATAASAPMLLVAAAVEVAMTDPEFGPATTELPFLLSVLYLGVFATAAAWYLWYKGLEFVDSGTISVFFFAQPIVGSALGAALLGERLGPRFFLGGAIMAVGVYAVSTRTGV